jgi:hypothetical protein
MKLLTAKRGEKAVWLILRVKPTRAWASAVLWIEGLEKVDQTAG